MEKDYQNTNHIEKDANDIETKKPEHVIEIVDISIEIIDHVDDGKPKMSEKRKAFIKNKKKRGCLWAARIFFLLFLLSPSISNSVVSCILGGLCLLAALCFWGAYTDYCTPESDGYSPWWYGAL